MIGSRSILLGLVIVALAFASRRETLGWVLIADGVLQLFDALQAVALRKRTVAVLPAVVRSRRTGGRRPSARELKTMRTLAALLVVAYTCARDRTRTEAGACR